MTYVVKAAAIQTLVDGHYAHLYEGSPVPPSVKGEQLKALVDEGLVGKEDATEENTAPDADKSAPAPVK